MATAVVGGGSDEEDLLQLNTSRSRLRPPPLPPATLAEAVGGRRNWINGKQPNYILFATSLDWLAHHAGVTWTACNFVEVPPI